MNASAPEIVRALEEAASGLLFPSETDAPIAPLELTLKDAQGDELSPEALLGAQGLPEGTRVETLSAEELFAPFLEAGDDDSQKYQRLLAILNGELTGVRAYRAPTRDDPTTIDVFILGRHSSGAWIGLKTRVVET
jgi:hypothetical protein